MPRGSSPKRERQYEHIKDGYEKRGKSAGKAEEIAARTVNKERAQAGETKASRSKSSRSSSSSRSASRSSDKPSASRSKSSKASSSSSRSSSRGSDKPSASRGSGNSGRTRQQLYAEAKRKGIEGRSTMNKAQLERALGR